MHQGHGGYNVPVVIFHLRRLDGDAPRQKVSKDGEMLKIHFQNKSILTKLHYFVH